MADLEQAAKVRQAERMYAAKTPVTEIAAVLGVGRATIYWTLAKHTSNPMFVP